MPNTSLEARTQAPMSTLSVAVIVPASDSPRHLPACLAAIAASSSAPDELIVIEEGDGGPSAARNLGAARAGSEILLFVDSDVEIAAGAIAAVRAAFAADPGLAALFGAYDDNPPEEGAVSRFRNLLHHHVHRRSAGRATTFWAGLGAIRREWFDVAGGFDSTRYLLASIEDIELGGRIVSLGGRIELRPEIQGKHLKRWTIASMVITDVFRRGVPWGELLLEQRSVSRSLNLGWRHRGSALLTLVAGALAVARRPGRALIAVLALAGLQSRFLGLLARRGGPALVAAGLPLLLLHHGCAAASLPIACARVLARRRP